MFERRIRTAWTTILAVSREMSLKRESLRDNLQKLIEAKEKLISEYKALTNSNTANEFDDGEIAEKLLELQRSLKWSQEQLEELNLEIETDLDPLKGLKEFDIESFPDHIQHFYAGHFVNYESTRNTYYALETFCFFVKQGMNPPSWALSHLYDGFHKFLSNGVPSPDILPKYLGLTGTTSGATSPWDEIERRRNRSEAMVDMWVLYRYFDLSINRAAEIVVMKYQLKESHKTIGKYFKATKFPSVQPPEDSLSIAERTKFVQSFPVAARKLISR